MFNEFAFLVNDSYIQTIIAFLVNKILSTWEVKYSPRARWVLYFSGSQIIVLNSKQQYMYKIGMFATHFRKMNKITQSRKFRLFKCEDLFELWIKVKTVEIWTLNENCAIDLYFSCVQFLMLIINKHIQYCRFVFFRIKEKSLIKIV